MARREPFGGGSSGAANAGGNRPIVGGGSRYRRKKQQQKKEMKSTTDSTDPSASSTVAATAGGEFQSGARKESSNIQHAKANPNAKTNPNAKGTKPKNTSSLDRFAQRFDDDDQSSFGGSSAGSSVGPTAAGGGGYGNGIGTGNGRGRGIGSGTGRGTSNTSADSHSVGSRSIHTAATDATVGSSVRRREGIGRHGNDNHEYGGSGSGGGGRSRTRNDVEMWAAARARQGVRFAAAASASAGGGTKSGGGTGGNGGKPAGNAPGGRGRPPLPPPAHGRTPFAASSKSNRRGSGGTTAEATPHSLKTPKMTNTAAAVAAAKTATLEAANAATGVGATSKEDAKKRSRKSLLLGRKSRSPNGGVMGALAASPASRRIDAGAGSTGFAAAQMTTLAGILPASKPNTTPTKSPRFVGKTEPLRSTSAKKKTRKLSFAIHSDDADRADDPDRSRQEETQPVDTASGWAAEMVAASAKTKNVPRPGFIQESPPSGLEESPVPSPSSYGVEPGKASNKSTGDDSKESKNGMDCSEDDHGLGMASSSSSEASSEASPELRDKISSRRNGQTANGKRRFSIRMPEELKEARIASEKEEKIVSSKPTVSGATSKESVLTQQSHLPVVPRLDAVSSLDRARRSQPDDEGVMAAMLSTGNHGSGGRARYVNPTAGASRSPDHYVASPPKPIVGSTIKIHRSNSLDASEMTAHTGARGYVKTEGVSIQDRATGAALEARIDSDTDGSAASYESIERYPAVLITFIQSKLPPGWLVRLSMSKNKPYYTHPDFGQSWFCPVRIDYGEYAARSAPPSPAQTSVSGSFAESPPSEPSLKERLNRSALSPPGSDMSLSGAALGKMTAKSHGVDAESLTGSVGSRYGADTSDAGVDVEVAIESGVSRHRKNEDGSAVAASLSGPGRNFDEFGEEIPTSNIRIGHDKLLDGTAKVEVASATSSKEGAERVVTISAFDHNANSNKKNGTVEEIGGTSSPSSIASRAVNIDGVDTNDDEVGIRKHALKFNDDGSHGSRFGNNDGDFPLCDDEGFDDDTVAEAESEGKLDGGLDPGFLRSPSFLSPAFQKKRKSICASPLDLTKSSQSNDEDGASETKIGNAGDVVGEIEIYSDGISMVSSLAAPAANRTRKVKKEKVGSIDDDENASIYSWRTHTGLSRPLCSLQQLDTIVTEELARQKQQTKKKKLKSGGAGAVKKKKKKAAKKLKQEMED